MSLWLRKLHTRDLVQPLPRPGAVEHRRDRFVRHPPRQHPHESDCVARCAPAVLAGAILLDLESRVVAAVPADHRIERVVPILGQPPANRFATGTAFGSPWKARMSRDSRRSISIALIYIAAIYTRGSGIAYRLCRSLPRLDPWPMADPPSQTNRL